LSLPIRYKPPSARAIARIDGQLALKAAAANRPPSYGSGWGTYLPGAGFGPEGGQRDYLREAGRIDLNPLVRLILAWFADAVTQVSFRVGRQIKKGARKGEYEVNSTHGLNRILRRPSPVFGFRDTFAQFIAGILIDGNCYGIIVEDNGGQPAEVWWVPNWQVEVRAGDDPRRPIAGYRIHGLDGSWVEYPPGLVLHIRDLPDPRNPLIGLGRLKCFLPYLLAVQNAGEYTNEAFRKGNTGIVLMPPEGAGPAGYSHVEEAEMLGHKRRLDRGLAAGGTTPIMYLTSFLVHEKIGLSPQEMSAETIVDRPESYILAAAGLSPLLFDIPSSSNSRTYSNKAEARRGAWEDSAVPLFGLIAEGVQDQVLYRVDPDTGDEEGRYGDAPGLEVWADTSEVPALQENMTEKAEHWIALVDTGMVKREYAASQLDIPEEAIPEEEEEEEEAGDFNPNPAPADEEPFPEDEEDEDEEDAASVKAARGGGRRKKKGDKDGRRVKPECSRAMSAIGGGRGTPADFAQAGRCRAARNSEKRSERDRQQGDGFAQRARATDRFAREMSTRKERVARVKGVLEKVRSGNAARRDPSSAPLDTTASHVAAMNRGGGLAKIPEIHDRVRMTHPEMTRERFHDILRDGQRQDLWVLQKANDPRLEPRAAEGIRTPDGLRFYAQILPAGEARAARAAPRPTTAPATPSERTPAPSPSLTPRPELADHRSRVEDLYERAKGQVGYADIDREIAAIGKSLDKDGAIRLAREFNIFGSLRSKKAALDAIHRRITGRLEAFNRTDF
jgi:hypothetical protein